MGTVYCILSLCIFIGNGLCHIDISTNYSVFHTIPSTILNVGNLFSMQMIDAVQDREAQSCGRAKQDDPAGQQCGGDSQEDCLIMDTVGAICIDSRGHIASGASSGGIALKVMPSIFQKYLSDELLSMPA